MYAVRKEELADYAERLNLFINQISGYALYMIDTSGCVLSWNAGAERLLGYKGNEIIGVAHNPKMAVCAEGVETAGQFTAVKDQGCDSAQGYLPSAPLDVHEMTRLIDAELAH